jgi:ABC-type nitrate/sulfonate/bicarbonate transport system substrate-binding protein
LTLGIATALWPKEARCADVIRLGEGPFLSGGGFFVAQAMDYFKKLGLDVQVREFQDGALAVPSFISGELDMSFMTANASLFNSIAKGAPLLIILDRGHNRPGRPYTVINVSQSMADQGVRSLLVEGGARIAGSLIGAGLVDRLVIFRAPLALGENALEAFAYAPEGFASSLRETRVVEQRRFGEDVMTTYALQDVSCSPD